MKHWDGEERPQLLDTVVRCFKPVGSICVFPQQYGSWLEATPLFLLCLVLQFQHGSAALVSCEKTRINGLPWVMASAWEPIRLALRLKELVHLTIQSLAASPIHLCNECSAAAGYLTILSILNGVEVAYNRPFMLDICPEGALYNFCEEHWNSVFKNKMKICLCFDWMCWMVHRPHFKGAFDIKTWLSLGSAALWMLGCKPCLEGVFPH